jgi:Bacterial Ig-like domain
MNCTDTAQTTCSRLSAQRIVSALVVVLLTACPTEVKTPTVTLAGVAAVTTESTLMLTAIAAPAIGSGFDNVGPAITKVELYDSTKKLAEKTVAPYVFEVKLNSSDNGKKQFKAKVYDQAGAVGESNTVTVDVDIKLPDTTPPTVVSVDPPNGAIGVTNDKAITITFSEPMNQQATQAAFQSVDLPSNAVTFAWSADGKAVTIKPNASLEYKVVSSPSDAPRAYSVSVTSTATDLSGNKLFESKSAFSTLKQIKITLESLSSLTGSIKNSFSSLVCEYICVGDTAENTGLRGFISFDLSILPSNLETKNIINVDFKFDVISVNGYPSNSLKFRDQNSHTYFFYIENVSYIDLEQSSYYVNINSLVKSYDQENCEILCQAGSPGRGSYIVSALDALKSDWENKTSRGKRSQYRFRFPKETNSDSLLDYTVFANNPSTPSLVVTYLLP